MPSRPTAPSPALPNPLRTLKPRAKPRQTESAEQIALFDWLRYWTPREPRFGFIFPIPNGGKRDAATAARMKREGVLPGVWDIFVLNSCPPPDPRMALSTQQSRGLFIEMKSLTGTLTPEQKAFREFAEANGYICHVARSWIDAAVSICDFLGVTDQAVLAGIAINEKGPRPVKGAKP